MQEMSRMYSQLTERPIAISLSHALVLAAMLATPALSYAQQPPVQCTPAAPLVRVVELPEGSGLAASRREPGRFWSLNDSSDPVLIALDNRGRVVGRMELSGAAVEDWEALAVGPCPSGSCIYVADIGDNDAARARITIYRIDEPAEASGSAKVSAVFHATYPDGAHDAEALLIAPDGRLHIVTKGDTGPVALYRFPHELRSSSTMRLERVGEPRHARPPSRIDRITDGAVSADGQWVVLRSVQALMFFRSTDLLAANWREAARVDLSALAEPQGEGVTFAADNSVFLVSEGGGKQRPGSFARLTCTLEP
jgi:hypothetical protein